MNNSKDKNKNSERVSYSTKLHLAFRSGNRCAICQTELASEEKEGFRKSIGEAHHIRPKGDKKDPRYDPLYPKDKLHSEENLIYLCNECHDEVQYNPKKYAVEFQLQIKKEHEESFANMGATISRHDEEKEEFEKEFEEFSLLPMLREFDKRRRHWLKDRLECAFKEFNPINYQGKLDSTFPQTGRRISVWKKDYGMMPDEYYKFNTIQIYDKTESIKLIPFEGEGLPFGSDSYTIRNVLDTEFAKIILDLLMLEEAQNESCFIYEEFSEIVENISHFNKPILLLDTSSDDLIDWNSKGRNLLKDIFFSRNTAIGDYRKAMIKVNSFDLSVIRYYIPSNLRKIYPKFSKVKGIFIDQDKVEYRIKEPLRVEWRIKKEEVKVTEHYKDSSEVVFDKDFFDFRCFTLAEIKNYGSTIIWKYTDEELLKIEETQEIFKRLTKKRTQNE